MRRRTASLPTPPSPKTVSIIIRNEIFHDVPEDALFNLTHVRYCSDGYPIIREGQEGTALYILLQGKATVYTERSECILASLKPGAVFGEVAALYGGERRLATIRAQEPCLVAMLYLDDIKQMAREYPQVLGRLRIKAKRHLRAVEAIKPVEEVKVGPEDIKPFPEFKQHPAEALHLFLSDCIGLKLRPEQKIVILSDKLYILVKGEGSLSTALSKPKTVFSGAVFGLEADMFTALTACVVVSVRRPVYEAFLQGYQVHYADTSDLDLVTVNEDVGIVRIEKTVLGSRRQAYYSFDSEIESSRKRIRQDSDLIDLSREQDVDDEALFRLTSSVNCLILNGCWMVTDAGVEHFINNCPQLKKLSLDDCWNLTSASLMHLGRLKDLKVLSLSNLDAADEKVIRLLPEMLEFIDVSYCGNIEDWGHFNRFVKLGKLVARRSQITKASGSLPSAVDEINLSECPWLTSEVLAVLTMTTNPSFLDISSCSSLSADAIDVIARMTNLRTLRVANCRFVNDVSLKSIIDALPNLETLDVSLCEDVHCLVELFKHNKTIKNLKYDRSGIDNRQRAILECKYSQ